MHQELYNKLQGCINTMDAEITAPEHHQTKAPIPTVPCKSIGVMEKSTIFQSWFQSCKNFHEKRTFVCTFLHLGFWKGYHLRAIIKDYISYILIGTRGLYNGPITGDNLSRGFVFQTN